MVLPVKVFEVRGLEGDPRDRLTGWRESEQVEGEELQLVTEVLDLMDNTGFQDLACVQTLFHDVARMPTADPDRPGYGEGSFVVVRGTKTLSMSAGPP